MPLKLSTKWATNNKALLDLVVEGEKKVEAKEKELKAQAKKLKKAEAEVTQLKGELIKSYDAVAEGLTLKAQLEASTARGH